MCLDMTVIHVYVCACSNSVSAFVLVFVYICMSVLCKFTLFFLSMNAGRFFDNDERKCELN